MNPTVRHYRLYDSSPIANIAGSIDIRSCGISASNTLKHRLTRAIPSIDGATPVAGLRRVARINEHHGRADQPCLIADKRAELEERPVAVPRPPRFPNRYALTDMRQVFQRHRSGAACGFLDQLLGNPMVFVRLEATLMAAELLQAPHCTDRHRYPWRGSRCPGERRAPDRHHPAWTHPRYTSPGRRTAPSGPPNRSRPGMSGATNAVGHHTQTEWAGGARRQPSRYLSCDDRW